MLEFSGSKNPQPRHRGPPKRRRKMNKASSIVLAVFMIASMGLLAACGAPPTAVPTQRPPPSRPR